MKHVCAMVAVLKNVKDDLKICADWLLILDNDEILGATVDNAIEGRNTPFTSASVTNGKAGLVWSVSGMGGSLKRDDARKCYLYFKRHLAVLYVRLLLLFKVEIFFNLQKCRSK